MDTQKVWVDFRAVKQAVSIEMVLEHYNLLNGLRRNGDELRGRCPIHKGEGERAFQVNVIKNAFQCFSCKSRGNVLDFVAAMEECSIRDAAIKLKAWFKVGESELSPTLRQPVDKGWSEGVEDEDAGMPATINPPLSFELRVDHTHEYGQSRGLSLKTLETFGAGLCISNGMFAGRFVIPLHNRVGELVGYAGRSLDDGEPKYLFPSRDKGFHKSHLLFNLHRILKVLPIEKPVLLVEGFFSTMKIAQAGFACVSLLGSSLSEAQKELLCAHFKSVLIWMDDDEAGRRATDECLARLGRRLWIRAVSLPQNAQPDQLTYKEILSILAQNSLTID
jgi:DNA primase